MLAARFGLSARRDDVEDDAAPRAGGAARAARRERGESTVLVIDEAQSLPLELLEEIRLLANIETANEKLLSVILAGQPELARSAERAIAAPIEAAGRAAVRAAAADAAGKLRVRRRTDSRGRRRRRADVHPRGGDADARATRTASRARST